MDTRVYYKDENAIIICGDMLVDSKIPDEHIDLIVTSPPYNVSKDYANANDNLSYDEYLKFSEKWLKNATTFQKLMGGFA